MSTAVSSIHNFHIRCSSTIHLEKDGHIFSRQAYEEQITRCHVTYQDDSNNGMMKITSLLNPSTCPQSGPVLVCLCSIGLGER